MPVVGLDSQRHLHHTLSWSRHTLEIVFFELNSIRKCDAPVETHDVWHSGKVLPLHSAVSLVTMLKGALLKSALHFPITLTDYKRGIKNKRQISAGLGEKK